MSESSVPAQNPASGASAFGSAGGNYQLSDDLARLCLPQEYTDSCRTLAWVNSICFLFLVVGLIGLKPPQVIHKPVTEVADTVPVIFTPPEETPQTQPEVKPDEPDQPQETTQDTPQVATVVAAADPASVAFAVPVQGAVAIAPAAHLATPPPPPTVHSPPPATKFNPSTAGGGSYPPPQYPGIALRSHYEGSVSVEFAVDATGRVTSVKLEKSSGFPVLDEAAIDTIKNRWRFPPGAERRYTWVCQFKLE